MPRFFLWLLAAVVLASTSVSRAAQRPPNIVLIFIDDLGWKDIGCYGNEFVETPHIDRLAEEGLRFTQFYASGAVCSPTRCALQSGQNQARIGITAHIPGHWRPFERVQTPPTTMALPSEIVTVAESLKRCGYKTGYVGKWHLSNGPETSPAAQGYDFAVEINGPHFEGRYRTTDPKIRPRKGQYRTDFEAELCERFIDASAEDPFFLMVSPFAVHIPLGAMSDKVAKYRAKAGADSDSHLPHPIYAAMIEHVDDLVGRVLSQLKASGVEDETLVVFTSDNGGLYRRYDYRPAADRTVAVQTPLRGEKGTLFEGGIRVPLIIRHPKMVIAGQTCDQPAITHDFYKTFLSLAGGPLPLNQVNDGQDLTPLFQMPESALDREALYWHYPHYHHDRPATAIRVGDWKLIEYLDGTQETLLFNLSADLSEQQDLSAKHPGRVKSMASQIKQWRRKVVARMPIQNPHHDPDRAEEWWSRRSGKPVDSDSRKRFPGTEKDL